MTKASKEKKELEKMHERIPVNIRLPRGLVQLIDTEIDIYSLDRFPAIKNRTELLERAAIKFLKQRSRDRQPATEAATA